MAQALVTTASDALDEWLDLLDPVSATSPHPLAAIFRARDTPRHRARPGHQGPRRVRPRRSGHAGRPDHGCRSAGVSKASSRSPSSKFDKVYPVLQAELHKEPKSGRSIASTRRGPSPTPLSLMRSNRPRGPVDDRFAFCQDDAAGRFKTVAEGLRKLGLPPRAAPALCRWAVGEGRGGLDPRRPGLADGDGSSPPRSCSARMRSIGREKLIPVDVAGYIAKGQDGKPVDRYAALWVEAGDGDDARMYVGENSRTSPRDPGWTHRRGVAPLHASGPPPAGWHLEDERRLGPPALKWTGSRGGPRTLRGQFRGGPRQAERQGPHRHIGQRRRSARGPGASVSRRPATWPRRPCGESPANLDALRSRVPGELRLGRAGRGARDLNALIGAGRTTPDVLLDRAIVQAGLGKGKAAGMTSPNSSERTRRTAPSCPRR